MRQPSAHRPGRGWIAGIRESWGTPRRRRSTRTTQACDPLEIRALLAGDTFAEGTFRAEVDVPEPVGAGAATEHDPLFRAYNPTADYHFFTTSRAEFDNAVRSGYRDETAGRTGLYVSNTPQPGFSPIYRLYNLQTGRHYYTLSTGERDALVNLVPPPSFGPDARTVGWRYEKIEGYIRPGGGTGGTTEVYRLYNNNSGVHLYVETPAAKDAILARFPGIWVQHSSFGFAATRAISDTQHLAYNGAPLKVLEIYGQGQPLNPALPIQLDFRLSDGTTQSIVAAGMNGENIIAAVPPVLGFGGGRDGAATVSVRVRQGGVSFTAFSHFRIEALAETGLIPGQVLQIYVDEATARLDAQMRTARALGAASGGRINVQPWISELTTQKTRLEELSDNALFIQFGAVESITIGQRTNGQPVVMDMNSLALLDRILAAMADEELTPGAHARAPARENPGDDPFVDPFEPSDPFDPFDDPDDPFFFFDSQSPATAQTGESRSVPPVSVPAAGDDELDFAKKIGTNLVDGLKGSLQEGVKVAQKKISQVAALIPGGTLIGAAAEGVATLVGAAFNFAGERASNIARGETNTPDGRYREFLAIVEPAVGALMPALQEVLNRYESSGALGDLLDSALKVRTVIDSVAPGSMFNQTQSTLASGGVRQPGARVSTSGSEVSESGSGVSITFDDFAPRSEPLTVRARVSDGSEGSVFPSEITLSPDDDFASAQFEVSSVDDAEDDGDQSFQVSFEVETEDPAYGGYTPPPVSLRTRDDGVNSNPGGGGGGGGDDDGTLGDVFNAIGTYVGTTVSDYGDPQSPYDTTLRITSQSGNAVSGTITFINNAGQQGSAGVSGTAMGTGSLSRLSLRTDSGESIELGGGEDSLSGKVTRVFQGQEFTQSISLTRQ